MKFKISVADLQYATKMTRDVAPTKGPSAEACGVLITASNGFSTFTAINPEVVVRATVKTDTEVEGQAVVAASALFSATAGFQIPGADGIGTDAVTVSVSGTPKKLKLSTKTSYKNGTIVPHRRSFPLLNHEFFPTISEPKIKASFEIPAEILMDAFNNISYALSSDKNLMVFTGAFFSVCDKELTLVGSDGVCLAENKIPIVAVAEPLETIVPGAFVVKVAKSFFAGDSVVVAFTDKRLFISNPNLTIGGSIINEEYPDYASILPKVLIEAVVDKSIFLDNLLNLNYDASQVDHARVRVDVLAGELTLRCGHSVNEGIPVESEKAFAFECSLPLLVKSIKNIVSNKIRIGFSGRDKPLRFSSQESDLDYELTTVLVPLAEVS